MGDKSSFILKKFGNQVRQLRSKNGVSQEDLAFDTGLDRTYISGIERGVRNPTLKNVWKISKSLKVSLKDLFSF